MTYEQELRRLYELLVAADDQSRVVLEAGYAAGRSLDDVSDMFNMAAGINHMLFTVRTLIKDEQ